MRDINRIPRILEKIKQVWQKYPDLRFGQLHYNICSDLTTSRDFFYLEDDEFEEALDKLLKELDN